ncbi:hypothetical protein D3X11_03745 [Streptococcus sp. X16XC17]|uniref:sulfatase-like hydrolase/transferase n=1 Tax=unclassified Streptococcus TaxID=2608887 RepID=UPI00066FC8F5|nr:MULTISPECIES: sulfatase-like hydrolase/transferase [unclassified Streptococcus]TCD46512.1 hypothetical protein D3X11_03745 [Streptococcus sp. X16XC17]
MKNIFKKNIFSRGQIFVSLLIILLMSVFLFLFRNEFYTGINSGNIKIVASSEKNESSIATDENIQDIVVNGFKTTGFQRNDWITEDSTHLVEQTYYSSGEEQVIEIQADTPIVTLSFISQNMPTGGILQVYVDDQLHTEIDSFASEQSLDSHTYVFPGVIRVTKDNVLWYLGTIVLIVFSIVFVYKRLYEQLTIKDGVVWIILSALSFFVMSWAFQHHTLGYVDFWKNTFGDLTLFILLPVIFALLLICFKVLYYWSQTGDAAKIVNKCITAATYASVPFLTFYIIENGYSSYLNVESSFVLYNLVAYIAIYLVFSWLFGSFKPAGVLLLTMALIFGVMTNILIGTRSEPLLPHHFYQLTTGLSVAGKTTYVFNNRVLQSFLLTFLSAGILLLNPEKLNGFSYLVAKKQLSRKWKWSARLASVILAILFGLFLLPNMLLGYAWQADFELNTQRMQSTYAKKGFYLAFSHYYLSAQLEKPENYGNDTVEEIFSNYKKIESTSSQMPNIIIIQNESQSDYTQLTNLEFSVDPMEFQHSLTENSISGETYVSVFGGGTSNTEYEMLTSNALAGLPLNIFPFQQLVNGKSDSLAWTLSNYGYETVAMHPETKNNYRRERVYDYLGFDSRYFKDSEPSIMKLIGDVEYERGFMSDKSLYKGIQKLLETKSSNQPLFNFVVTMQGHGSYASSPADYERTVTVTNVPEQNDPATEYLTSLKSSDAALKDLVTFLKSYKEPTVLVMYGDHHPTLSSEFFGNYMDKTDPSAKYQTPLIIWSNFDIPEQTDVSLSVNYLVPYLLAMLSETDHQVPISSYYNYMYQLYKEVPIQMTWGYYDAQNNFMDSPLNSDLLQDYPNILYNHVEDSKHFLNYYQ